MTQNQDSPSSAAPATTAGRPVRRIKRALTEEEALEIVGTTDHAVLSTADAAGVPYGVPVSPVYHNGKLYFHSLALAGGRKADNIAMNPAVSVCFIRRDTTLPEHFSVDYESAIVAGRAFRVEDPAEWHEALVALCRRHCPNETAEAVEAEIRKYAKATGVWRIDIESLSGKSRAGSRAAPQSGHKEE